MTPAELAQKVRFTWRDGVDYPSLQLIEWAQENLRPGTYECRFLREANSYAIRDGYGDIVATWPSTVSAEPDFGPPRGELRVEDQSSRLVGVEPPMG